LKLISSQRKAREIVEISKQHNKEKWVRSPGNKGAFEADPLSRLMLNGTLCIPPEQGFDYLASVVQSATFLPQFRAMHINASNFNNAGSDIVQELAFAISMGSEYMLQLTDRGISVDIAASKIRFSFGTGSNYFPEIAKLRAARLLWTVVINGFLPSKSGSNKNGYTLCYKRME